LLRGRRRALAIAAALTIPTIAALYLGTRAPASPQLTMLDVGQGDALVLRAGGKVLLVDGGGRVDFERFGETTLLPLLADRGIRRVDVVVLSHVHPDHCGGLPAVVTRMRAGEVWISPRRFEGDCAQRLLEACRVAMVPIHLVRDGEVRRLGAVELRAFLADRTFRRAPENNASVVLQVGLAKSHILLTGDIEREAESEIAPRLAQADVLKIAHHGSRSSTTAPLLDAVRPRVALISCGRHNIFGHPHAAVLEALRARGIRIWRTDRDGTVEIELRDGHLFVRRAR
jgi:competence protein ComEC